MKRFLALIALAALAVGCSGERSAKPAVTPVKSDDPVAQRGIDQCAALWRAEDGTQADFEAFVREWLAPTPEARRDLFDKLCRALEIFRTQQNQLTIQLGRPVILDEGEPGEIGYLLSQYDAYAHYSDDMFDNKLAFITILNFPNYTLEEKNALGPQWSRLEWAYARMGDVFTDRVPADVNQDGGNRRGRVLYRHLQHRDGAPAHRGRPAPVPGGYVAAFPLEPA